MLCASSSWIGRQSFVVGGGLECARPLESDRLTVYLRAAWMRKPHKLRVSVRETRAVKHRLIIRSLKNEMVQNEIADNRLCHFRNGETQVPAASPRLTERGASPAVRSPLHQILKRESLWTRGLGLGLWRCCRITKHSEGFPFLGHGHNSHDLAPEEQCKPCGCIRVYFNSE